MRHIKPLSLLKLSSVVAALALQGAALAAAPGTAGAQTAAPAAQDGAQSAASAPADKTGHRWHNAMRERHLRNAMWVPGYGPVAASVIPTLSLTPAQTKLLDDARNAQKEQRKNTRGALREAKQSQFEQLKAGKIDPHAALDRSTSLRAQAVAAHKSLDQKWLALWDSLDAAQQKKIADYFNQRAEKRAAHADRGAGGAQGSNAAKPASASGSGS